MCFKYVSDNADESASKNWKANASLGATAFKDMIKNLDLQTMLSLREKEQYEN